MYFLNDKHNLYDYGLYCVSNGGKPYIKFIVSDIFILNSYIREIEKKHNHYRQSFYIDNNFYNNEYSKEFSKFYYKVLRRNVQDWQDLDSINTEENIIFLKNFK